jgi:hypothetical protein
VQVFGREILEKDMTKIKTGKATTTTTTTTPGPPDTKTFITSLEAILGFSNVVQSSIL